MCQHHCNAVGTDDEESEIKTQRPRAAHDIMHAREREANDKSSRDSKSDLYSMYNYDTGMRCTRRTSVVHNISRCYVLHTSECGVRSPFSPTTTVANDIKLLLHNRNAIVRYRFLDEPE